MATKSKAPKNRRTHTADKTVLKLPDLDQAKSAVLNSLSSKDAQRGYRHAIDEFVDWYCSEPRLSFSRTVVLRYRMHLESQNLRPVPSICVSAQSGGSRMRPRTRVLSPILRPASAESRASRSSE